MLDFLEFPNYVISVIKHRLHIEWNTVDLSRCILEQKYNLITFSLLNKKHQLPSIIMKTKMLLSARKIP